MTLERLARPEQIKELANTIAQQAEAIATGTTMADIHAVALLMHANAALLTAWTDFKKEKP